MGKIPQQTLGSPHIICGCDRQRKDARRKQREIIPKRLVRLKSDVPNKTRKPVSNTQTIDTVPRTMMTFKCSIHTTKAQTNMMYVHIYPHLKTFTIWRNTGLLRLVQSLFFNFRRIFCRRTDKPSVPTARTFSPIPPLAPSFTKTTLRHFPRQPGLLCLPSIVESTRPQDVHPLHLSSVQGYILCCRVNTDTKGGGEGGHG